jgi:hypothetical protein
MNDAGQYYLFESVAFGIPVYWGRNHFPWNLLWGNLFLQLQELKIFLKINSTEKLNRFTL